MQRPVQIDFQGMKPRGALRAIIAEQVAGLEDRFGRITACRVVVKAPSEHHRTGGLYEINIRLALPDGKEVDIGRTPRLDQRHADVHFALNDAFKRARRQLQDMPRNAINYGGPIDLVAPTSDLAAEIIQLTGTVPTKRLASIR
jgi:hypothetical protein